MSDWLHKCPWKLIDLDVSNFEFWISIFIFFHCACLEKTTTNVWYPKFDSSKLMSCQGHKSNILYFHRLLRIQYGILWIVIYYNCKSNKKLKYFSLAMSWLLNHPLYFFLNKTRLQAQHDQIKDSHFDAVVDQQFQNTVLCTVILKYQNQIQSGLFYRF